MNLKPRNTFLRFLIAGGVNTLFGWLAFSSAIFLGAQSWLALIAATFTGIGFNFITLGAYAFEDMTLKRLPRFMLSYGCIYTTNLICLKAMKPWVDNPIVGQLILTPPIAIFSYVLFSRLVFHKVAKNA